MKIGCSILAPETKLSQVQEMLGSKVCILSMACPAQKFALIIGFAGP